MPPASNDAAPPLAAGRYRLVERLGAGGMALVYRGWDTRLQVWRAVKVLGHVALANAELRARFEREASTMARLRHRNVLVVHDTGQDDERPYIVTELAPGGSIQDHLGRDGPLPPRMACEVVAAVLDALATAHHEGVVHRDVKPSNILVDHEGQPLLADFGIAQLRDDRATRTGLGVGTLGYVAPEQLRDAASVDGRADVYAAGATLFTLLTGLPPPAADPGDEALASVPESLRRPIRRAMGSDRAERHPDAAVFRDELLATIGTLPAEARRTLGPVGAPLPSPPPGGGESTTAPATWGPTDGWAPPVEAPPRRGRPASRTRAAVAGFALLGVAGLLGVAALAVRRDAPREYGAASRVTDLSGDAFVESAILVGDGHRLAYANRDGIWVRDLVTGTTSLLTPERAQYLTAHPSVGLVAAMGPDRIVRVDLESGAVRELRRGRAPTLSPDGRSVAYVVDETDAVWVAPVEDGRAVLVRAYPAHTELGGVVWSPDGESLALLSNVPGRSRAEGSDLEVVRVDGTGTNVVALDERLWTTGGLAAMAWPEPRRLLAASRRPAGESALVEIDPMSGTIREVARLPFGSVGQLSVDGDRVALVGGRESSGLFLVDPLRPDLPLTDLTDPQEVPRLLGWSDARHLWYAVARGSGSDLLVRELGAPLPDRVATLLSGTPVVHSAGVLLFGGVGSIPLRLGPSQRHVAVEPLANDARRPRCTPDLARCVGVEDRGDELVIVVIDADDGASVRDLARVANRGVGIDLALAVDGRSVAVPDPGGVQVWTEDGASWDRREAPAGVVVQAVAFAVDGAMFVTGYTGDVQFGVWRVDGAGWSRLLSTVRWPRAAIDSTDGATLAVELHDYEASIWMLPSTRPR